MGGSGEQPWDTAARPGQERAVLALAARGLRDEVGPAGSLGLRRDSRMGQAEDQ